MAIIIPSKSIYNKENNKLVDNIITNVNCNYIEKQTNLDKITNDIVIMPYNVNSNNFTFTGSNSSLNGENSFTNELVFEKYMKFTFNKDNYFLKSLNTADVNYYLVEDIEYIKNDNSTNNFRKSIPLAFTHSTKNYDKDANTIECYINQNLVGDINNDTGSFTINALFVTKINFYIIGVYIENVNKYINNNSNFELQSNSIVSDMTGIYGTKTALSTDVAYIEKSYLTTTSKYKYIVKLYKPLESNITIPVLYNNTTTLSFNILAGNIQSLLSYTSSTDIPFEIISQNVTYQGVTQPSYQILSNKIISSYANGKETATIKCSINNYYNEDNTIAKSITDTTKDMTFRIYDEVIPMILTPNGDAPMSKKLDNTAKVFKVLGTKLINNGAVWQELYLQEK